MIDKLAWLRIEEKKVLCVRSVGKDLFYMPGGKRDEGETDQQALLREIKEELSVELDTDSLAFYGQIEAQADGKPAGVMVRIRCYHAQYQGELTVDSEIEQLAWLGYEDIEQCSVVVKLLFEQLHREGLI